MSHDNRSRLTVDTNGKWGLYTNTIPADSEAIGTVMRSNGDKGALVRMASTGIYVQVNAGVLRSLDGRKVAAALGLSGRPVEMDGGKRVNVYLDDASLKVASGLGSGNVSEGIRTALRQANGT